MFQAVSSIVCGFILALAATVLLIQVKWHMISTLWPRFGNYYLWIRVHLCYFPLLQLSIYQNFLVEQYEAKVCIHQLLAFVEQQSRLTLSSCISNLLANKPLPFLFRWGDNQTCSHILPRCSLEFWRLSPPFSIFLLLPLPTRPSRTICEFWVFSQIYMSRF